MSSILVSRLWFSIALQYPFPDALGSFRMNFSLAIAFIIGIFAGADQLETLYWMGLLKGMFSGSSTNFVGLKSGIPTAQTSLTNLISSGGSDLSRLFPGFRVVSSVPVTFGTITHMGISRWLLLSDN